MTNRNSWGPNTLIKQGAKLTATWEDIWEELPAAVQRQLESEWGPEASEHKAAGTSATASLFASDDKVSPREKKILSVLRPDESTHIDTIIEKLEGEVSSSEIFASLFELELNGKIKQLPGKNYVKSF